MKFKKKLNQPYIYLSIALCCCFTGCDSGSGSGGDSGLVEDLDADPVFEAGFNPETLLLNSQVWIINTSDDSNFVGNVISDNTIDYTYTTFGNRVTSLNNSYIYSSLGTSASLISNFNFTGDTSIYNALTSELGDATSALSVALAEFVASDESTAASVVSAANDASPNLILFFDKGTFYTLDSLELNADNDSQGIQILTGSPITFTGNVAAEGSGATTTKTDVVEISYRNPIGF